MSSTAAAISFARATRHENPFFSRPEEFLRTVLDRSGPPRPYRG